MGNLLSFWRGGTCANRSETRSATKKQTFGDVEARDFYANVGTVIHVSDPGPSQTLSTEKRGGKVKIGRRRRKKLEKKFLDIINQNASRKTEEKIIGQFEDLKKPDRQVNPGFQITKYYQGQTALDSDVYQPDTRYSTWRKYEGMSVGLDQFLDGVHYAALIGDAGSGKTTAAKRFTQHVLKREIKSLKLIRLVHFVTLASIDGQKEHTLFDLIFAPFMSYELTEQLGKFGYEWVREHRSEILLVFDGLDQANWRLENNDSLPKINYNDKASAPVIFHNLLNEGLLENCKILLTSREHAIKDFTFNNRPAVTISLTGLTMDDRLYLIHELSGNSADNVLQHLQHISPEVLSLCESPLLLQFSVAVLVPDSTNSPDTFSGILLRVLAHFCLSEKWGKEVEFRRTFKKLKRLAYNGTSEGRVLFSFDELKRLDLKIEEIRNLMAVTPQKGTRPHFRLMEEGSFFILFFCHQSIQEALTALHVAELPLEEFQSFVSSELLQPRMEVVRRLLFGILFGTSAGSQEDSLMTSDINNKSSKMDHLKNWLNETYIPQEKDGKCLCRLLSECGSMLGDVCNGHLPRLNCKELLLSDENQFALASVLRALSDIDELSMLDTRYLNSTTLSTLAENVMKIRKLQVVYLELPNEDDEPQCDAFVKIARHATYKGYRVDPNNRPDNIERWLEVLKNKGFQFLPMQVSADRATITVSRTVSDPEPEFGVDDVPVNEVQSHFLKWLKKASSSDNLGFWGPEDLWIKPTGQGQLIFAPSFESSQDSRFDRKRFMSQAPDPTKPGLETSPVMHASSSVSPKIAATDHKPTEVFQDAKMGTKSAVLENEPQEAKGQPHSSVTYQQNFENCQVIIQKGTGDCAPQMHLDQGTSVVAAYVAMDQSSMDLKSNEDTVRVDGTVGQTKNKDPAVDQRFVAGNVGRGRSRITKTTNRHITSVSAHGREPAKQSQKEESSCSDSDMAGPSNAPD